jgi:putative DNA primase/helicase
MDEKELVGKVVGLERAKREARRQVDKEEREAIRPPNLVGFSLDEILVHKFPKRRVLLSRGEYPILRAGNIAQVFAYRGVGKTWFLETLALVAAYRVEALGLCAPDAVRVLYVDGEMASEDVKDRLQLLVDKLSVQPKFGAQLTIVGADWQEEYLPRLDTPSGQAAIEPFIDDADLVILDNRSSLFDPEGEKDPTAWQLAQDWLLSLRRRGKAVVMAHHANRQGGARGIGKAEDVIDLNLKLSRPEDYKPDHGARFVVEFDKARGVHGPAAATFEAALGTDGWTIKVAGEDDNNVEQKIREYLKVAAQLGESPKSANNVWSNVRGNRGNVLKTVAEMISAGQVVKEGGELRLARIKESEL